MTETCVVVPVWDSEAQSGYTQHFVEQCLTMTPGDFTLVVVDNASPAPQTQVLLATVHDSRFVVLRNTENEGYGRAANRGLLHGFDVLNATYGIVLNNDIFLCRPEWLEEILTPLRANPRQLVGARYIDWNDGTKYSLDKPIPYLEGWCLAMHRQFRDDVGLFDPAFFAWHEDVDLCYRAAQAGYPLTQVPSFTWLPHSGIGMGPLIHAYGQTGFQKLNFNKISEESRQYFIAKHFPKEATPPCAP